MLDQYKIEGQVKKVEVEIEQKVAETLQTMSTYTKKSVSELANTALKRFISSHKDFMPPASAKK